MIFQVRAYRTHLSSSLEIGRRCNVQIKQLEPLRAIRREDSTIRIRGTRGESKEFLNGNVVVFNQLKDRIEDGLIVRDDPDVPPLCVGQGFRIERLPKR